MTEYALIMPHSFARRKKHVLCEDASEIIVFVTLRFINRLSCHQANKNEIHTPWNKIIFIHLEAAPSIDVIHLK